MPGPVSDSYHPIWGTSSNREDIAAAIQKVKNKITVELGDNLKYILKVVHEDINFNSSKKIEFGERDLRIIRFALRVALGEDEL